MRGQQSEDEPELLCSHISVFGSILCREKNGTPDQCVQGYAVSAVIPYRAIPKTSPPHTHLDAAVKHPATRGVRHDALVQLKDLPPGVAQVQLGVQVVQLRGAGDEEVAQSRVRVRAGLQRGGIGEERDGQG